MHSKTICLILESIDMVQKKYVSLQALTCLKKAEATDVLILTLFYFKLVLFSYSVYEWNAIVSLLIANRNISFQRYKDLG